MAVRAFNSIGGFSVGENPIRIIEPTGHVTTQRIDAGGVYTDNLLHANGDPWVSTIVAGNSYQIQYNINDELSASPNLTFVDSSTPVLYVNGDIAATGNVVLGLSAISSRTVITYSSTPYQTLVALPISSFRGVEYFIKAENVADGAFQISTVLAVHNGVFADSTTYGTISMGGGAGDLGVIISDNKLVLYTSPYEFLNPVTWTVQYKTV